jgi:hypothetical protein
MTTFQKKKKNIIFLLNVDVTLRINLARAGDVHQLPLVSPF